MIPVLLSSGSTTASGAMSSSSGCSLLLLLASSPSACLPSHFRRCLPALKTRGKHRVYLDYVAPDEEKPLKVFRSCQLVRKLHRIAGPAEIDLMVLSRGFKATESRPRMDHTVKEVLLWPDFDASGTHGDILRGAERISVLSEEDLDPSFDKEEHISDSDEDDKAATADFVVLGGTFDRLHAGHKILLTDALLRCRRKMTIGVTDTQMIKKKVLPELILPCQQRIAHLQEYLRSCDPDLEYNVSVFLYCTFGVQSILYSRSAHKRNCRLSRSLILSDPRPKIHRWS